MPGRTELIRISLRLTARDGDESDERVRRDDRSVAGQRGEQRLEVLGELRESTFT